MRSLDIGSLRSAYEAGALTPEELVESLYSELDASASSAWTYRLTRVQALARARSLGPPSEAAHLPLYGIPFSVKDNIDVGGMPTTLGCPSLAYVAERSTPVVAALERAGALCLGKANLDQLSSSLSGSHSPFAVCRNVFDPAYLAGGSSSGSALTVAEHQVSFSLGTDLAGSARIPAALNNLVALKPSRWLLPNQSFAHPRGHLDAIAVLAHSVGDAALVRDVAAEAPQPKSLIPRGFCYAVPAQLDFCGDRESAALFERSAAYLRFLGGTQRDIDFAPFAELGELLRVLSSVEEYMFLGELVERSSATVLPFVRHVLERGRQFSASQVLRAYHQAEHLKRVCAAALSEVSFLLLPTVPTHLRLEEDASEPLRVDKQLGTYTRFVDLLGAPSLSVPAGFRSDGLPFGLSLVGHEGLDSQLEPFGRALHDYSRAGAGKRPDEARPKQLATIARASEMPPKLPSLARLP
jgi:allophanate hydrolase